MLERGRDARRLRPRPARRQPISGFATTPEAASASRSATRTPTAGPPKAGGTCPRAPAKPCSRVTLSRASTISTPSTTTAAANGSGTAFMCTRDKEFTIRGIGDCLARGFDRTGFFEVDTGEQRAWTVQLTESSEQTPQHPLRPGNPLAPPPAGVRAPGAKARAARARKPGPMRRRRRTKVVATLGPASSGRIIIAPAVRGRRRRVPHQHESHHPRQDARAGDHDPRRRGRVQPADRHPGRSAGAEAAARQLQERLGRDRQRPGFHPRLPIRRRATPRASICRIRKSSPRSRPATRFSSTTASCASSSPRRARSASSRASRSAARSRTARA